MNLPSRFFPNSRKRIALCHSHRSDSGLGCGSISHANRERLTHPGQCGRRQRHSTPLHNLALVSKVPWHHLATWQRKSTLSANEFIITVRVQNDGLTFYSIISNASVFSEPTVSSVRYHTMYQWTSPASARRGTASRGSCAFGEELANRIAFSC
jgi:hypothetical protein